MGMFFFFSSRRRHTRYWRDWSSDVCSSDLEGHRKVWARLRAMDGIRVSRKRVLRLMREHALLSPHRARPRPDTPHDRHIVTASPTVMWACDGTQVATVRDGKVWLFGIAEHWNAELLGWQDRKSVV